MSATESVASPGDSRRSPWVWVFLALWLAWLAALIVMSRTEWGKAKPLRAPDDTPREELPRQRTLE
jgi:hypothetical protein